MEWEEDTAGEEEQVAEAVAAGSHQVEQVATEEREGMVGRLAEDHH
jgi:hypothetical protein